VVQARAPDAEHDGARAQGGPNAGLRLVFRVTPANEAAADKALRVARERLDPLGHGTEISLRRLGVDIVLEIGPTSAERVADIRQAMLRRDGLFVAACDDGSDPLAGVSLGELPAGVEIEREVVGSGASAMETHYARSDDATRRRLLEWVRGRIGSGQQVAVGRTRVTGGPSWRSYVLAGAPIALDVSRGDVRDDGSGAVELVLSPESARTFGRVTADNVQRRVAILLGDEVEVAPIVMEAITGGKLVITMSGPEPEREGHELLQRLELVHSNVTLDLVREEQFGASSR
jgi:SecDF, P1 head subdomain